MSATESPGGARRPRAFAILAVGALVLSVIAYELVTSGDTDEFVGNTFDTLTVSDATNVDRTALHGLDATQLSYNVTLEFPQRAIGDEQYEGLRGLGWKACEGKKATWSQFVDEGGGEAHCAYQFLKYLVKRDKMLLISLRYQAPADSTNHCPPSPGNSTQRVLAVVSDYPTALSVWSERRRLGLACD